MPHQDLHDVPFQVLQDPSDQRFLGERFEISYAPSATLLLGLDRKRALAPGRLLAVAAPDIAEARGEVEAIAALHPGARVETGALARETDVKSWAAGYDLLHFSVHGVFKPLEPLRSHLELSPGGGDDGDLTAAEVFGLSLDAARLVVMSACETGQAKATHGNELLGMVRALLYAGAGRLVLSSWKVDAAATALWMTTFYREALTVPPSTAARRALQAVRREPGFEHPYFWAPFMMVGR